MVIVNSFSTMPWTRSSHVPASIDGGKSAVSMR